MQNLFCMQLGPHNVMRELDTKFCFLGVSMDVFWGGTAYKRILTVHSIRLLLLSLDTKFYFLEVCMCVCAGGDPR